LRKVSHGGSSGGQHVRDRSFLQSQTVHAAAGGSCGSHSNPKGGLIMAKPVNELKTARKVLKLAAAKGAALRELHTPTQIVVDDSGDADEFYHAVEEVMTALGPEHTDFEKALEGLGLTREAFDTLWNLYCDSDSAAQRAAFALGVAFASGGAR
jgi:hypothetical protein